MERYLAFAGFIYYPCGGMGDFIGDFDDRLKAVSACEKHKAEESAGAPEYHWYHVWDSVTRKTVETDNGG